MPMTIVMSKIVDERLEARGKKGDQNRVTEVVSKVYETVPLLRVQLTSFRPFSVNAKPDSDGMCLVLLGTSLGGFD